MIYGLDFFELLK